MLIWHQKYRVSSLSHDLKDVAVCSLLKERGDETEVPERCIVRLIRKLEGHSEFPHEMTGSRLLVDIDYCW